MATVIKVPALGIAIANITVLRWFVREGEAVAHGQPLLEVQTDKLAMEIPSEASGVLRKVLLPEGAQTAEGVPLAIIGEAREDIASLLAGLRTATPVSAPGGGAPAPAVAASPEASAAGASGKLLASPLAKRIARERGIDLSEVTPSGAGGRITEQDVLRHVEQTAAGAPAPAGVGAGAEGPARRASDADGPVEVIPLQGARKIVADNLLRSARAAPRFTTGIEVDCSRLVALRNGLRDGYKKDHGVDLTYVPFVVKAMARAVEHVPIVNARIRDEAIIVHKVVHVGVAVATGDLVYVPVIREPAAKALWKIGREVEEHAALVRSNRLAPEHLSGGTITLTNMGVTEVDVRPGIAVLNDFQAAIVAMGRVRDRAVAVAGQVAVRPIMDLSFTYDHRIVMGVPGAKYAEWVKHYLEHPELLTAA
jgi:2-oxoglutarate dehydrogenase E2 component (dihydrolipoamide succinyltransferase)